MKYAHKLLTCLALSGALLFSHAHAMSLLGTEPGRGTWVRTLHARDLNLDGETDAFYDTALDITWLRNAAYIYRQPWDIAVSAAADFEIGGFKHWRLSNMIDVGGDGCNFGSGTDCAFNPLTLSGGITYSELAHLWYVTLGNRSTVSGPGGAPALPDAGFVNVGGFQNFEIWFMWTGLKYAPDPDQAWYLGTEAGFQGAQRKSAGGLGMLVHDGDLRPVPLPGTALSLSGALAVLLLRRRRAGLR